MRLLIISICLALWLTGAATSYRAEANTSDASRPQVAAVSTQQTGPPYLENGGFECSGGYHDQEGISGMVPDGWNAVYNPTLPFRQPFMCSTQMWRQSYCDPTSSNGYEKLEGLDSYVFVSTDIEQPPDPGKPFDATIFQHVTVTPGTAYSISVWMTSLCGGSTTPNDCPAGYFISKMAGLDPTGGTVPSAPTVTWARDDRPHTTARWADVSVAATAQSTSMTVFVRVVSPFQHHGNHVFADAVSIVRAPTAQFQGLPAQVSQRSVTLNYAGDLGPDISAIPGGNHHLYYQLQYRVGESGDWRTLLIEESATSANFLATAPGSDLVYYFRVRARAEQPDGEPGARPNHRFPGDWTTSGPVRFGPNLPALAQAYMPAVQRP